MSNLPLPHHASWCKVGSARLQWMNNGSWSNNPLSVYKVPGQSPQRWHAKPDEPDTIPDPNNPGQEIPNPEVTSATEWARAYFFQLDLGGSHVAAWCSSVQFLGGVHSQWQRGIAGYKTTVPSRQSNGITSSMKERVKGGICPELPKSCDQGGDAHCANSVDGINPKGGPSDKVGTTYWNYTFESFLENNMGPCRITQECDAHACARVFQSKSSRTGYATVRNLDDLAEGGEKSWELGFEKHKSREHHIYGGHLR